MDVAVGLINGFGVGNGHRLVEADEDLHFALHSLDVATEGCHAVGVVTLRGVLVGRGVFLARLYGGELAAWCLVVAAVEFNGGEGGQRLAGMGLGRGCEGQGSRCGASLSTLGSEARNGSRSIGGGCFEYFDVIDYQVVGAHRADAVESHVPCAVGIDGEGDVILHPVFVLDGTRVHHGLGKRLDGSALSHLHLEAFGRLLVEYADAEAQLVFA